METGIHSVIRKDRSVALWSIGDRSQIPTRAFAIVNVLPHRRVMFWLISFLDNNWDYKLFIVDKTLEVFWPAENIREYGRRLGGGGVRKYR